MGIAFQNMDISVLANYFIIGLSSFCLSAYVVCKAQNRKISRKQIFLLVLFGIILSLIFTVIRLFTASFAHFVRFVISSAFLAIIFNEKGRFNKQILIGVISISFETVCEAISFVLLATIIYLIGVVPSDLVAYLLVVLLKSIICIAFINIRRFKNGFDFFCKEQNLGLGIAISVVVLILKCVDLRKSSENNYLFIVSLIGFIIAGFGLYLWIRRSITAHYRERMQLKSEEYYQKKLAESEERTEKLNQTNEYLAKIVHRDNHLMNTLNTSLDAYFSSSDARFKDDLLHGLQIMARERGELIEKEQLVSKLLPSTGNPLIDSAINNLYIKAASRGIDFSLTVSSTVDEIIGKYILQTDLQTLLCDHIKDAVIAVETKGEGHGRILVSFSMKNDIYDISVYDSGVDFEIDTLSQLGTAYVTTHSDNGGNGLGFMTTFETIKKAYASLIITEFENKTPFSKSVSFRFDGSSAFIIQSYRCDELKTCIQRDDVTIV